MAAKDNNFKVETLVSAAALETRLNELRDLKIDPIHITGQGTSLTVAYLNPAITFLVQATVRYPITSDIIET